VAEYENSIGETDEWLTPASIFEALGCRFDLDPCQPSDGRAFLSVPCDRFMTKEDDGLMMPWHNYFVWMNPPFGKRNGVVPWLEKFFRHGNGIGLVLARTSAGWFHDWMPLADAFVFPRGKTRFVRPDGTVGKSPGQGAVLFSSGERGTYFLRNCGLGIFVSMKDAK
jgi:hypothetical protein